MFQNRFRRILRIDITPGTFSCRIFQQEPLERGVVVFFFFTLAITITDELFSLEVVLVPNLERIRSTLLGPIYGRLQNSGIGLQPFIGSNGFKPVGHRSKGDEGGNGRENRKEQGGGQFSDKRCSLGRNGRSLHRQYLNLYAQLINATSTPITRAVETTVLAPVPSNRPQKAARPTRSA